MSTPYQTLIAQKEQERNNLLQRQQNQKRSEIGEALSKGLAADALFNDGGIRKEAGKYIADQLGIGSTPTPTTNIGQALNPGTDPSTGFSLNANATPEPGTAFFDVGAPSTAGYVAGAIRGYQGIKGYLNTPYERDRNREALWSGLMVPANVATGGLASLGEAALNKFVPPETANKIKQGIIYSNPITAPIGAVMSITGSSKDKDQVGRDQVRKSFGELGFVDGEFNVSLADGTKFNIGVDGKAKPEYGIDPNTGKAMHAFDLNHSDPLVKQLVPMVNPLVNVLTGGDKKLASDFTGYLVRAAMSNSGGDMKKAMANVQGFYKQLNAAPQALSASIDSMLAEKKIDAQTAAIWKNDINKATAGMNFGSQGTGSQIIIGGGGYKPAPIPKPAPQPYSSSRSPSQNYNARVEQTQGVQGQDMGAMYSNFAKNFVPQSQSSRFSRREQ